MVREMKSWGERNLRRHEPDPKPDRAWCQEGHELKEAHELKLPHSNIGLRAPTRATPSPSTTLIRGAESDRLFGAALAGRSPSDRVCTPMF